MIKRAIEAKARDLWRKYPVLTITGPRQSGKTTLTGMAFPDAEYVNMEDPENHALASADMREFLRRHPAPAIFDEVQYVPELLRYIQADVDRTRKTSQYVLTGSHQPALQSAVTQTLAGRTGILELLPFSMAEMKAAEISKGRDEWLYSGFMPRLYDSAITPTELYRDYFLTYVERDVRQLANLRRLNEFELFIRLLAGRVGQLLNMNSLSDDVGVTVATVKEWLSVLEASYVIRLLRPYYRNFGKRFVKSPKIYFTETGLAAYLVGIRNASQVATHPLMGGLFENLVVMDIIKGRLNRGEEPDAYFLRTSNGVEADIALENEGMLDLYEVKAASTFRADMSLNIDRLSALIQTPGHRAVVYSGRTLGCVKGVNYTNFADL